MKPLITSFTDYNNANISEQLNLIKKLKFKNLFIRKINGEPFYLLNEKDQKSLTKSLNDINIIAADPLIDAPHLNNLDEVNKANLKIKLAAISAKLLNSESLCLRLPIYDDFVNDKDNFLNLIKEQVKIIKDEKLKVILIFNDKHQAATYRLVIEKLKDNTIKIAYDPSYIYLNNENVNTTYRLLNNKIDYIILDDFDKSGTPRLINSGNAYKLKDLFKTLIKTNYNGKIVLDSKLVEFLPKVNNYKWYHKFSKNKKYHQRVLDDFKTISNDLSPFSIINIQLEALEIIFKT